jgi:uncharacterized protein
MRASISNGFHYHNLRPEDGFSLMNRCNGERRPAAIVSMSNGIQPLNLDEPMDLDHKLMDILACPQCKGELVIDDAHHGLVCPVCRLRYPVEQGIPMMLIEQAERLED